MVLSQGLGGLPYIVMHVLKKMIRACVHVHVHERERN